MNWRREHGKALVSRALLWSAAAGLAGASLAPLPPAAAQTTDQQKQKIGETVVTADNIDYDLGKKQVIAAGNVELVTATSRLTSDKMTVQMTPARGLDWAKCEGKVFVEKKDPEKNTTTTANGQTLDYSETNQTAQLSGGVVTHVSSPRLAKPAVITGSRVDMDLAKDVHVVHKSDGAQAKVHVEPKGEEGKGTPEPLDLMGDQITMNGPTQEYIATGNPSLMKPTSKLKARVIRFTVESGSNDVKKAYAEKDVVFDGTNENGSVIHTTAENGVFDRTTNEMILTGRVLATIKDPGDERPTVYQGGKFTYNTVTRGSRLSSDGTTKASVLVPGGNGAALVPGAGKKPDPPKPDPAKPDAAKPEDKK
jgi:lipopolysaccharide transport protein LptA